MNVLYIRMDCQARQSQPNIESSSNTISLCITRYFFRLLWPNHMYVCIRVCVYMCLYMFVNNSIQCFSHPLTNFTFSYVCIIIRSFAGVYYHTYFVSFIFAGVFFFFFFNETRERPPDIAVDIVWTLAVSYH